MPSLEFKGKQFVYTHHLSVPFRTLEIDAEKSLADEDGPRLDDNLIIHGDNLHALKALLPMYAGKVDCVFIDPPYNTGNEGWCYNDRVNAPLMREWLKKEANPVDKEDLERHDKWLCMMWPRMQLLRELLTERGSIWITLDDNEIHRARSMMDEVFGESNFVACVIWQKVYGPKNTARHFSEDHDYVLLYAKNASEWVPHLLPRTEEMEARYDNPDNDPRGPWKASDLTARNYYSKGKYEVVGPTGRTFTSGSRYWRQSYANFLELNKDNRVWWGPDGNNMPAQKRFLSEVKQGLVPQTLWSYSDAGHTQDAKKELLGILGSTEDNEVFVTPKPTKLLTRILHIATSSNAIIVDSFAGSGTTAQAVLALNKEDGGHRKFILVEMEDYADTTTAERVRRVMQGVAGARDEALRGGLGGSFTYCTLGEEINIESLLRGGELPSYEALARYVFHTATGQTLAEVPEGREDWYIGETQNERVHLIYKAERGFLRSMESALNAEKVELIAGGPGRAKGKPAIVFASAKFMGQQELTRRDIRFCQLPYAIHRLLGE